MKQSNGWQKAFAENPEQTAMDIAACVEAETLLMMAVAKVDIDWCIERLQQMKKRKFTRMIDTILHVLASTPAEK